MAHSLGIHQHLLAHAQNRPDKALFVLPDGREISYRQTLEMTSRIAAKLIADGVRPGDRVAVQVGKSPESVALYLATQQIGAVIVPLNTAYTPSEIAYFLEDASPRVFVCAPGAEVEHDPDSGAGPVRETLGVRGDGSLLSAADPYTDAWTGGPEDLAAILYTSGTTGRSKGAMLTRANLASNCASLLEAWEFTADDRLIHALPIFHIHGLFVAVNMSIAAGASMFFLPGFDADLVLDLLPKATVLMGVPTFYTRLLSDPRLDRDVCASMRLFVAGSAPLLATDHRKFEERTGHVILERYGMTETGMNTTNPYVGARKAGTVGLPLPGVSVRIAKRDTGEPVAPGDVGVVEVRGPNVFVGYWGMPEKTAAEFRSDGYFITGDLGRFDEDGYLCIVGRDKDLVITGGFNVYPKEVEELIDAHPRVSESAVIGVPHPDLGEAVLAVVVCADGDELEAAPLLASIAPRLARFKQPRAVRVIDELPRNAMGKVQKAALRERFADAFIAAGAGPDGAEVRS